MSTDQDLLSLLPKAQVSRREFVGGLLASGFALAVQPVSAQTISTDSNGLEAGAIQLGYGYDSIPAYRAMPAAGENFPVVLVVQEIFGVHEHIKDVCRRLAKQGYLAIAPELFYRQGDVSKLQDIKQIIDTVVSKVPDAQVMKDLDSAVKWADGNKGDIKRLAVTGFCYGGRIVWLYAAHSEQVKAGVAWYGRLKGKASANQPKFPLDVSAALRAPVLGLYGGKDQGIALADVEEMQAALKQAGNSKTQIVVYPDAQHGFHADYRPSYDAPSAQDGWQRMLAWFKQHGAG